MRVGDKEGFDRYRGTYRQEVEESIAFSGADLDYFTQAKVRVLLELASGLGEPSELAFLDIGCGPGETDRFLEGRIGRLCGVDQSIGMVEEARRANPWAEYAHSPEGSPLPYANGSFDVCFAICVLHHVPVALRLEFVREMVRVCRPGGLVAVFEHNPRNPLTRRAVRGCEFDRDAVLLGRREAMGLLLAAGLPDVRARYIEFFPRESRLLSAIERRLGRLPLGAQYAVFAQRP